MSERYPESEKLTAASEAREAAPCDWCGGSGEILEIWQANILSAPKLRAMRVPCPQCSPAGVRDA